MPKPGWPELEAFVEAHGTQREAAKALRISQPYLCDMLNQKRDISENILKKLGLKVVRTVVSR